MALRRLDHLLVLTDDVVETTRFYRELLGLEPGDRPALPFPGVWLYLDGVPCVHVAERKAYEANAARMGLAVGEAPIDHAGFAAEGYEELVARLEQAGVETTTNVVPGAGLRQLFFTDPNGLRIELNVVDDLQRGGRARPCSGLRSQAGSPDL
jgi:catechol 2,3-dioxygenase-like lactoylglutathione lyase family enzyme